MRLHCYIGALLAACLMQYTAHSASTNLPVHSLVLLDVQGLFGGHDLWIQSNGVAVVKAVRREEKLRELQERQYIVRLSDSQMSALGKLLGEQDFLNIKVPERPLAPDEALPIIWVQTKTGARAAAMKPVNDTHKQFDAVYSHLLTLIETIKKGDLGYLGAGAGTYYREQRPDGFPRWQEIYNLAVKNSKVRPQIKIE
jgi:hypothetical protein